MVTAGQTLKSALSLLPIFKDRNFIIHKMELLPGTFYPRIARSSAIPNYHELSNEIMGSLNQIRALIGMLDRIVQTIHPTGINLNCFGTDIRNLIILTCTECEAQWRGVVQANGIIKNSFRTGDYVRILHPMRLAEYKVKLRHFPWLEVQSPYADWNDEQPTKSLDWYDDYNAIKHDREKSFDRATLGTAIRAISALWIMMKAQYGDNALNEFDDLSRYFLFDSIPLWPYSEVYTHTYDIAPPTYIPINCPLLVP